VRRLILISGAVAVAASACLGSNSSLGGSSRAPVVGGTAGPAAPTPQSVAEALRACTVSTPGGPTPPAGLPPAPYIGNGRVWVGLWPHGLVIVPRSNIGRDGELRMKFMWWRGSTARGLLHISGNDVASGAPLRARSRGYGLAGFNASSIFFPGPGCYRVTGRAGGARLTFVTLVRTCSALPQLPPSWRQRYSTWCNS